MLIKGIKTIVMVCLCSLFFLGCNEEEVVFTGNTVTVATEDIVEEEAANLEEDIDELPEGVEEVEQDVIITIHICGAVRNPGVYSLPMGSRIYDGIQAAGGFTEEASEDYINQAMELADGVQVIIPTHDEVLAMMEEDSQDVDAEVYFGALQEESSFGVLGEESQVETEDGKVNINTASIDELCTLSGIGASRAQSIIDYREENGGFQQITDIMNISGIKEASFAAIEEFITVN